MNDTAETITAHNASVIGCARRRSPPPCLRWREGQRTMWPVPIVVIDESCKDPFKVLLVENQQPVETFRADGAHESLANALCDRLIGTIRRECLDFVIPLNERHVRNVLREWIAHCNGGRPSARLGPGIPDPPNDGPAPVSSGHHIREGHRVIAKPVLGELHHEYGLKPMAA